jgi:hypothetical protein
MTWHGLLNTFCQRWDEIQIPSMSSSNVSELWSGDEAPNQMVILTQVLLKYLPKENLFRSQIELEEKCLKSKVILDIFFFLFSFLFFHFSFSFFFFLFSFFFFLFSFFFFLFSFFFFLFSFFIFVFSFFFFLFSFSFLIFVYLF